MIRKFNTATNALADIHGGLEEAINSLVIPDPRFRYVGETAFWHNEMRFLDTTRTIEAVVVIPEGEVVIARKPVTEIIAAMKTEKLRTFTGVKKDEKLQAFFKKTGRRVVKLKQRDQDFERMASWSIACSEKTGLSEGSRLYVSISGLIGQEKQQEVFILSTIKMPLKSTGYSCGYFMAYEDARKHEAIPGQQDHSDGILLETRHVPDNLHNRFDYHKEAWQNGPPWVTSRSVIQKLADITIAISLAYTRRYNAYVAAKRMILALHQELTGETLELVPDSEGESFLDMAPPGKRARHE